MGAGSVRSASLVLRDLRSRETRHVPLSHLAVDVSFSLDGRTVAVTTEDALARRGELEIRSLPDLNRQEVLAVPLGHWGRFSPDGRLFIFGDDTGRVWFYDARTWKPRGGRLSAHTDSVITANVSSDGRMLATSSFDGTTRLWELPSRRPIGPSLPGPAKEPVAAAFLRNDAHLLTL
jgi:WD40 repeat protein